MKVKLTRKQSRPPNLAARALSQGRFQPKVADNPKGYSRKGRKNRGSLTDGQLPFSSEGEPEAPADDGKA